MKKRILMVAMHFPPWAASSGHLRILSFCRHLPEYGWEPAVLTTHPRAYAASHVPLYDNPMPGIRVYRAFALDAQKHLSIRGKYPSWLALPDRWSSWWPAGVVAGMQAIRELRPEVILSTFPVATAHMIALTLNWLTGIPWIADFRDPIGIGKSDDGALGRKARRWIDRRTLEVCTRAVFTTDGAKSKYCQRYEQVPPARLWTIPNGYDEETFAQAERSVASNPNLHNPPFRLLHSGSLYQDLRDLSALFRAVGELKREGRMDSTRVQLVFRASGDEDYCRRIAAKADIRDLVVFEPAIPYQNAIAEILTSDGLLLIQAAAANSQIPAKLYEYLRARRPILAITDCAGDTTALLKKAGVNSIAQYDSVHDIKRAFVDYVVALETNSWKLPDGCFVAHCTRASRAAELANLLNSIV